MYLKHDRMRRLKFAACGGLVLAAVVSSRADAGDEGSEVWAAHAQSTFVWQYHPAFHAPASGANSLEPQAQGKETFDITGYFGVRPWTGGELWINPEVDQGFGLSNTVGVAGFPSGEAYKVGRSNPYVRLQRLFFRQTFNTGGDSEPVAPDLNQLGGTHTTEGVTLTVGKLSVTDIFDVNAFAHDPRGDFLNWSVIDSGAYDYAADSWAYSYGIAVEWTRAWWTLRTGLFDLSQEPNAETLETGFQQFEIVAEAEERHTWWGRPGKVKLLGFVNRGRMGRYDDAVVLGQLTAATPDTALVRRFASRPGGAVNIEQSLTDDLGAFVRLSANDGTKEAYEFTEINKSVAAGIALKGTPWHRPDDTFGAAAVVNGLSSEAQAYFTAGGLGILIGDSQLLRYGVETIFETYYKAAVVRGVALSFDYQWIGHPAYNATRGPVSVFAVRLHGQF